MRSRKITHMLCATLTGAFIALATALPSDTNAAPLAGNDVALLPANGWQAIGTNYLATDFNLLLPAVVDGIGFSAWQSASSPATVESIDWFFFSEIGGSVIASGNTTDVTFGLLLPAVAEPNLLLPAVSDPELVKISFGIPPVLLLPAVSNYVAFHINLAPDSDGQTLFWASAADGEETGIEVVLDISGLPFVRQTGSAPNGSGANGFLFEINGASISETPLPAALPLFATGLGAVGLLAWRRKRKAVAA